ncbi:MAG TPA: hypothetical protein VMT20_21555 [Terriglobia bacterium]|nr:hypothetical protein [Terriglobia bacterium]
MRKLILAAALLLMIPALTPAQEGDHPYRGQGYLFFGLGAGTGAPSSAFFEHVGGGGEGFLYKGLAFGGEVDYAHSGKHYDFSQAWIGSVDFSYHLGRHAPPGKIDPFLLGGFSVVGPTEAGNGRGAPAGNFGGGANWWLGEHAALRFEFRDVVGGSTFWPYDHVLSFRVGVTFR